MKRDRRIMVWMLVSALTGFGARAVSPESAVRPYSSIVDRNVFNLHPPPPAIDPSELAKEKMQIPKLTLNGITTLLGKKVVILTMPGTKPGAAPQTLMLAEGQAEEEVEIKQIDEKAGVVKVNNHGRDETLDFEHDGTKPAPPAGNPAVPAITIPPIPAAPPANVQPNVIRPLRTLMPNRTTPQSSVFDTGNQQAPLSEEDRTLLIEAQRVKAIQDQDPVWKILPPTPRTGEILGGGEAPAPQ